MADLALRRKPTEREPQPGPPEPQPPAPSGTDAFWLRPVAVVLADLGSTENGLSSSEAAGRLSRYGTNTDAPEKRIRTLQALVLRTVEPLALLLLIAAAVSGASGDLVSAAIILVMVLLSVGLDTFQERRAAKAAEMLRRSVALRAEVRRDGGFVSIAATDVVPGDVIRIRAGDLVPADGLIVESSAFTTGEAALTGEPYPVEKRPGLATGASPADATNAVFRGSVAQTGEAIVLAVATGRNTLFGEAALALARSEAATPFQRDLRALGFLIARAAAVLSLGVLIANVLYGRPILQSVLFAVALAVGLTPELLPMITTVTLSRGAVRMARRRVIVKRLASIHDLGSMSVLCTDKTGTLTSAEITLSGSVDAVGAAAPRAAELGALAAILGGDRGALDQALAQANPNAAEGWRALQRRAFDFNRRMGSVLARDGGERLLIVKGAPEAVLVASAWKRAGGSAVALDEAGRTEALRQVKRAAEQGLRAVAVASRPALNGDMPPEAELTFEGFCTFADPPKPTAASALKRLADAGVTVKILSGDDPVVVARLAGEVQLASEAVLTGAEVARLGDDALAARAQSVNLFARLTPDQKVRVIHALRAKGAAVGFLGDGVNDAPGLKAADIGLSVGGATGVAQAAADMILLDPDLDVIADGIEEGRRTFANILKYIRMGASSNFGNMLSMAAASLFLPFLPMLAIQILLNNLLYDFSEIGIPFDRVHPDELKRPQRWNMKDLLRFAAVMGPVSSVFDLITFAGLIFVVQAAPAEFRTVWFLESLATQILVIFLIRSSRPLWEDWPHPALAISSLGALAVGLIVPFTPVGRLFAFQPPPAIVLFGVALVVVAYLACADLAKRAAVPPARLEVNQ